MNWLETIYQIRDLREPLTFHNDKSTVTLRDMQRFEDGEEFGCRASRSTKQVLDEHLLFQRRLRREMFALIHNRKVSSWK